MSAEYSEDILVQPTAANYFEQELGWRTIYAYNDETFGSGGMLGRSSRVEVILLPTLREALTRLNPGHPDPAYDDAIAAFTTTSAAKTELQINEEKYRYIRDGIPVEYRTATGEVRQPQLRLIDFDHSDNNDSGLTP